MGATVLSSIRRLRAGDLISDTLIRFPLLFHWMTVIAWAGLIFFLSDQPNLPSPPGTWSSVASIAGHFTVYFILSLLIITALRRSDVPTARAAVIGVALATLYGVSDEWHQSFVPGRHPSALDVLVDFIGAACAVPLALRLRVQSRSTNGEQG